MDEYHSSHNNGCCLLCPWLATWGQVSYSPPCVSLPLITHSSDTLTAHLTLAIYRSGSLHTVVHSPSVRIVMLYVCVSSGGAWSVVVSTCRPGGGSWVVVGVWAKRPLFYLTCSVHLKTVLWEQEGQD